ncbi:MAG: 5-(carboxyamino)imidazole ribonucleotide mutase [Acidobacteriota bacterium]
MIGILMGSRTDWEAMSGASETLEKLDIPCDVRILSAHRTPALVHEFATGAEERGLKAIIAGAGGAAHLAGVVAASTHLPVLGVPMKTSSLGGLDSLLSTVQMPKGITVATFGIGRSGAINAALHAAAILATSDASVRERLLGFREEQSKAVAAEGDPRKG